MVDYYLSGEAEKVIKEAEQNNTLTPYTIKNLKEQLHKNIEQAMRYKNIIKYGVWAFIDGHKSNLLLNHLTRPVPCWEAEIDNDTEVMIFNIISFNCENRDTFKVSEQICNAGFFIPASNMSSIKNIRRRYSKSSSIKKTNRKDSCYG